jgi:cell wall-associated NlpC family hydrolase
MTENAAATAASVVETALEAMGTPYQWGGTDANGFDCSGLIQYAYGQHGIILPRVSRDQARTGIAVKKSVEALAPGDVLTFSVDGSGISHVALFVGDGMFIHSSSQGVRLSSLTASDGDSQWWRARWVGARRVLN